MTGRTMFQQFEGGAHVSDADFNESESSPYLAALKDQIRRKGIKPTVSVHELAADIFESDEELDEFLAELYVWRHAPESMA